MNKDSTFSSEHLLFRGINETDTDSLVKWRSNPKVIRYFRQARPLTKADHEQWYRNKYCQDISRFDFVVIEKNERKAIGTVGVSCIDRKNQSCEISYMIAEPDHQRKGYAVEAISAMMKMMIKEEIYNFFAEIHAENIASRRTIEKLKYTCYREKSPFIIYYRQENKDAAHTS